MKVLVFEPNPYHYEVMPGFVWYFLHLGYEVDCLLREPSGFGDPFDRCPQLKEKIRFFYFQGGYGWKQRIPELQKQNSYDLLFCDSVDQWSEGENFNFTYIKPDGWYKYYLEMSALDQSRLGVICCVHELRRFKACAEKSPISTQRFVTLSPVDSEYGAFTEVNANFFCDAVEKKPKHPTARILSIGLSVDRYALWHAIRAAKRKTGKDVSLTCIGGKMPEKKRIWKFWGHILLRQEISDLYRNWPPLFPGRFSQNQLRELWHIPFPELYREVEEADFLDASVLPYSLEQFSANRTSGIKQLSLGFLKPCIIEKSVAAYYGFTERSAVIYEGDDPTEAICRAVNMSAEEYADMVSELEKLCTQVRERSKANLRALISRLEREKSGTGA